LQRADRTYTKEEVMDLMEPLVSAWFRERFDTLTEPQARAVPVIHERKNVLVSSPTGSGKTLTAFTSIINELTRYASEGKLEERVYCIYISPLKALANDIERNLNTPLAEMRAVAEAHGMNIPDIRVAVRSGDTPPNERQKMLRHPPHILITTPESMALILAAPKFRERISQVEWVILDEIHDICDSKRGAFLSLTLERLREFCEKDFTRIGLSATLAPIDAIAGFLAGVDPKGETRDVTLVESGSKKQLDLRVICPTEDMTALSSDIVNSMMYDELKELIDTHETTLVFTNTRSGAESVVYKLKERGLDNVEVHHSSLGRDIRLNVEERLKRGEIKCVVSSTSLELGIDIGSVDLVCQIGSPKSVAKGLQRIGRSGHSMGKVAKGRLLVFDPDDLVECAVMCRAAHRSDIDRVGIPENSLDVLSQTVVGMSLDKRWEVDRAFAVIKGSYCYRNLSMERFVSVLKYLGSKDEFEGVYSKIWYDEAEGVFGRKKGSRMIYYMNLGTIPEEANYRVITNHGSIAGELSEKFVERLSPRDIFVLGGRSFEFVRSKGMTAYVKEATGRKPTVPSWAGEMLPRSFDLSVDVAEFRREMAGRMDDSPANIKALSDEFDIDEGSARSLVSYFKEQQAVCGLIPDDKVLAVEEYIDPSGNQRLIFHFPFGRRVNDALSRGYAYRISNIVGSNVSVTMSDDNFMIGTPRKVDPAKIPGLLSSNDLGGILRKAVKDSEIFKLRFRHTAARSFMILRNYMGRPISINRQQLRSTYLLESLAEMEDFPVIEETYREVLEDDMDIKNARYILSLIEKGEVEMVPIPFSGTPSPFAHSIILTGFSDIVLMEDRSALLRELHRKVLYRALGDSVRDFEFEEDQVVPYFREKAGRITCKEDIPRLLMRTGPLQALRERGRNIYSYADDDKKTVDGWVRELLKEGSIGTVFLDEPHIMAVAEIRHYAAATRKERELTETDAAVLGCVEGQVALSDITERLGISEDVTFRSVRKLESMYLVTRTDVTSKNKWYFSRYSPEPEDRARAIDRTVYRYLGCFAPATVQEVAFALTLTESEARTSLEALTAAGEVSRGRFLISESDQYMHRIDHMRLRTGKNNVYDFETVERYRRRKGRRFGSIREYFEFYGTAGSVVDVFSRVEGFDLSRWHAMRESGEILLGRFARGRVRYVLSEDAYMYAALREPQTTPFDDRLLSIISGMGRATMREIVNQTKMEREEVKESLMRLDRSLKLIRAFDEREDGGSENIYEVFVPKVPPEDPLGRLLRRAILAYGPIPAAGLRHLLGLSPEDAARAAIGAGAVAISVGDGQTQMFIMPEEVSLLQEDGDDEEEEIRILSPYDPDLASKWAELNSLYGDRWVYPAVMGSSIVGALELWEMSGCIEIRSVDIRDPSFFPGVLRALDSLMAFFRMKGVDMVRIREVLNRDASDLEAETEAVLRSFGYRFVNGFYAKGRFSDRTFSEDEIIGYVLRKQRVLRSERYTTVYEAVAARGYIRGDAEILTRVAERTTMKKLMERGLLMETSLIPPYIGYTTPEFAYLYRAAKEHETDDDMRMLISLIKDHQPVSKKKMLEKSILSEDRTSEALNRLFRETAVFRDASSQYGLVQLRKMDRADAVREVIRMHFRDFGIFSAEGLGQFTGFRMPAVRRALLELEDEGFLVKGFFLRGDATPRWMLKEDADITVDTPEEMILLNTQDNLHLYLRDMIKRECGASENVIFQGTRIVASFKGKLTSTGAKIEGFRGSPEAYRFLMETARSLGVKIGREKEEEEEEWDPAEFYLKTNPGA
jgi:ATP-dependent Lhr-like helicase